jgi:hypothetical protein
LKSEKGKWQRSAVSYQGSALHLARPCSRLPGKQRLGCFLGQCEPKAATPRAWGERKTGRSWARRIAAGRWARPVNRGNHAPEDSVINDLRGAENAVEVIIEPLKSRRKTLVLSNAMLYQPKVHGIVARRMCAHPSVRGRRGDREFYRGTFEIR